MSNNNVAIIGHSFIRRLNEWIRRNMWPTTVGKNHVFLYGRSGAKVVHVAYGLSDIMRRRRHDCVVLQIGSNDLCDAEKTPDSVASSIFQIINTLKKKHSIKHIIIFEVLRRNKSNRYMEIELGLYNERVQTLNNRLQQWSSTQPNVHFQIHRRKAKRLADDGIHINERWMEHYCRSIMSAVAKIYCIHKHDRSISRVASHQRKLSTNKNNTGRY